MDSTDIKRNIDLKELFSEYGIKVNPKGFCCCPFHKEKTPSMKVDKTSYHCFGCGAHGDCFTFVMDYEHVTFTEAFKRLGGSYKPILTLRDKMRVDEEKRKREALKREKELEKKQLGFEKARLLFKVTALKSVKESEEPGSDVWHYAEDQLLQCYDNLEDYIKKGVNIYG